MAHRRAVVIGFDYYARYLSALMNERSQEWRFSSFPNTRLGIVRALWALRKADALVSFGGPGPSAALAEAAEMYRTTVIVIWAGTDVVTVAKNPSSLAVLKRRGFQNISDGAWLVDELRDLGIYAKYLPVTAVKTDDPPKPFPSVFRVLTYLPHPRRAFYGEEAVYDIARSLPNVEFVVIGAGEANPNAPSNVVFRGYVDDTPNQIDSCAVLLRLPQHDGKSMLVLEALARGRHVVWTHEFPGVRRVSDTGEALATIRELQEAHRAGTLTLNESGRQYVSDEFSRRHVAHRFESYLDDVVASHRKGRNGKSHHVAMSGLGVFCAEVATQIERSHPEWTISNLSVDSRLEVLAALLCLARAELWYSIGSPVTDRWVFLLAKLLRKRRVIHWVGSDIEYVSGKPALLAQLQSPNVKHLTEVTWTAEELRELGVASSIAALPLRHTSSGVKPLPDRFTVLLYLPEGRPEFYGRTAYEMLLRDFSDRVPRVIVVGGGTLQVPPGIEVVNLGWRDDLREAYLQATVLMRVTPRDGLSLMVLEALSFGRYVMWSKPFPYTMHVRSQQDLSAGLNSLLERHRSGRLNAQYAAAEMVARSYSNEGTVSQILETWKSML